VSQKKCVLFPSGEISGSDDERLNFLEGLVVQELLADGNVKITDGGTRRGTNMIAVVIHLHDPITAKQVHNGRRAGNALTGDGVDGDVANLRVLGEHVEQERYNLLCLMEGEYTGTCRSRR
jgi:hypothetical protein